MGANVVPISSRRCCCRPIGTAAGKNINESINYNDIY